MVYRFYFLHVLFLSAFLFIDWGSYAQELDLKSYIDLVKANNVDLKQSETQISISKADTRIARSALLPNVSINGFYQRDFNKNFLFINDFDGSITRLRTNFNNSVSGNAVLNQTVFDLAAFSAIKVVKLTEEISIMNDAQFSNELITHASSLYWQAIYTKQSIEVLTQNSNLAKDQFNQIKKLYKRGSVSDLQLQQAEVFYKKTLPILNSAKNQFKKLLNDLKLLANMPLSTSIVLTDNLETIRADELFKSDNVNLEEQPQLLTLKKQVEVANKQIEIEKTFWYPKVNLTTGYNYDSQANNLNFSANENKLFFLQVGINMPIFSGGRNKAKIARATFDREAAKLNFMKAKRDLLNQLKAAENNYLNAIANIETYKETIRLNENELDIFKKQLDLGVVTSIEFKESRLRLTQSRLELLNAYLDLHIAHLQIIRIKGQKS